MNRRQRVLSVENLSVSFLQYVGRLTQKKITPIGSLSVHVNAGEIHAIAGASGSGKSLLAHAILGILPRSAMCSGSMTYMDQPLTERRKERLRGREIAFIPQSVNYLDPLMKVGRQIRIGLPVKSAAQTERRLLEKYGLKQEDGSRYPFELSGGMLRRILFAASVREGVRLIIADEPTPGIHPEALSVILNQLRTCADAGAAVMLITHDILSALSVCDRVTVLQNGSAIETASADSFAGQGEKIRHPYTKALWSCLPVNDFTQSRMIAPCH